MFVSLHGVELAGIRKRFGGVTALNGVSLKIEPGEVHGLLGENGAGKSTLIRVLTGAIKPDEGEIRIDGVVQSFAHPRDAQAVGIAAVYQEPMIYPHLSVLENIFAGNEITSRFGTVRREEMENTIRPLFERLELDPSLIKRKMGELSLGYQQLVLIAKALTQNARVIIFDEPTSILSQTETDRLLKLIDRLRADGHAIVYITHRLDEIGRICDRVTVLTDGKVTGGAKANEIDEAKLLELMAGKSSRGYGEPRDDRQNPGPEPAAFTIRGLSRKGVYQNIDWTIHAGLVTGVYGLVGSGRSEVALAAFGALPPDKGTIMLEGKAISPKSPHEAIELGIGYLPEDRKLQGIFSTKSIESNLTVSALQCFTKALARLHLSGLYEEAMRLIKLYRIKTHNESIAIGTLSGGNQQKALFARWAGQSLKVLILDEPTRGIDISTKEEIHNFIRELAANGLPVVVISSDLPEILSVSDRVIVMQQGHVVAELSGEDMQAEIILSAAVGASARAA